MVLWLLTLINSRFHEMLTQVGRVSSDCKVDFLGDHCHRCHDCDRIKCSRMRATSELGIRLALVSIKESIGISEEN